MAGEVDLLSRDPESRGRGRHPSSNHIGVIITLDQSHRGRMGHYDRCKRESDLFWCGAGFRYRSPDKVTYYPDSGKNWRVEKKGREGPTKALRPDSAQKWSRS